MSSYTRFYKHPTIQEWAESSLSPTELNDFQNAFQENSELWAQYTQSGLISVEPIYETVTDSILENSINVQVGEKVVLSPGTSAADLHIAESYQYWLNRFNTAVGPDPVEFVVNNT